MATHNAGWVIGVVDGAIESASSPNASVLRLRTQVGTEPNGAPRLVTIPMTVSNAAVEARSSIFS